MGYSSPALQKLYEQVNKNVGSTEMSGIYVRKQGYHASRNDNRASWPNDYSIVAPADKRGDGNVGRALDMKMSERDMITCSKRLRKACEDGDPRIEPLREWIGTINGNTVSGYQRYQTHPGTRKVGFYASGYSDASHLWHLHLSVFTDYVLDVDKMLLVADVICGFPAKPAPKPTPKPDPVKPPKPPTPVPPGGKPELVIQLDAPGSGNWQGAVTNGKNWYLNEKTTTQSVFYRFDLKGKYLDKMAINTPGQTSFGVSKGEQVWCTWNLPGDNDVVTFKYQPGKTLTKKTQTKPVHVFSDGNCQVALSVTDKYAAVRDIRKTVEYFKLRKTADIRGNKDAQWGKTIKVPRRPGRTVQGFSCHTEFLYIITGHSNGPTNIEVWSFRTAKLVRIVDMSEVGHEVGDPGFQVVAGKATSPGKREAEGMHGNTFGVKQMQGNLRRLRIYRGGF